MDMYTLQEEAFKRGYKKGRDSAKEIGKWKTDMQGFVHCSICGEMAHWHLRDCQIKTKYCHSCGAKMEE